MVWGWNAAREGQTQSLLVSSGCNLKICNLTMMPINDNDVLAMKLFEILYN